MTRQVVSRCKWGEEPLVVPEGSRWQPVSGLFPALIMTREKKWQGSLLGCRGDQLGRTVVGTMLVMIKLLCSH